MFNLHPLAVGKIEPFCLAVYTNELNSPLEGNAEQGRYV